MAEAKKACLLLEAQRLRFDAGAELATDAAADALFVRLRNAEHDHLKPRHKLPPMIPFGEGRAIIDNESTVFDIIKRIPKAALLHSHVGALASRRWMVGAIKDEPHLWIAPLSTPTAVIPIFKFASEKPEKLENSGLPSESTSSGATDAAAFLTGWDDWIKAVDAFRDFDDSFESWILESLSCVDRSGDNEWTVWAHFSNCFRSDSGISGYAPFFERIIRHVLESYYSMGIYHIEARATNFRLHNLSGVKHPVSETYRIIRTYLADFNTSLQPEQIPMSFKLIYSPLRNISNEELKFCMDECAALYREFPDVLVGFDLVGHEENGRSLAEFMPTIEEWKSQETNPILPPFFFHAGETSSVGSQSALNVFDAVALGTKRIGHGYSIARYMQALAPSLQNICVEVCPLSNQILRLCSNLSNHPLATLLQHNIPVAICSDDPGMFGYEGVDYDYYMVAIAFEFITLKSLRVLVSNSIKYAEVDETRREALDHAFQKEWKIFEKWLLNSSDKLVKKSYDLSK
ncbi:hypothetical protein HK100_011944 [Physocladia obscura]|uniref:adenosine deaminase n=1 Tax=Physocladia obscura TaxID=109957 RepID=A0AAD5T9Y3_9FUNG|nr:hypothetical protein HK100_011944 [Physocladia obscura]